MPICNVLELIECRNKFSPEPAEVLAIRGDGGGGIWAHSVVLAFSWWFLVSGPMSQNWIKLSLLCSLHFTSIKGLLIKRCLLVIRPCDSDGSACIQSHPSFGHCGWSSRITIIASWDLHEQRKPTMLFNLWFRNIIMYSIICLCCGSKKRYLIWFWLSFPQ